MAEKKTWKQMSKGERTAGIIGLCIAVMVGIALIGGFVSAITSPSPQKEEEQVVETVEPVTKYDNVEEPEVIPFEKVSQDDASLDTGTTAITTKGVDGVRTKTYYVTYVDGKETAREVFREEVTKKPVTEVTSIGTREPYVPPVPSPAPQVQQSSCDPNYSGCVPIASDVDCAGGSGNGPAYTGMVQVIGSDIYGLDRDGDGWACE
jgi:hypothetical protein